MKFFRLGFLAALALTLCGQQALAADAFKIDPKIQQQSMKDAPPLVQQAGLDCSVTDAYLLGNGQEKIDGKTVKTTIYELACGHGDLGYILDSKPGAAPAIYDCLSLKNAADKAVAAKGKPDPTTCKLPENLDPKQGLAPLVVKGGGVCGTVTGGEWKGASASEKFNVYEAACADTAGYLILAPEPGATKPLQVVGCIKSETLGMTCELTTKEQVQQQIIKLAAPANRAACMPTKARWVVTDGGTGNDYYEVGCSDGSTSFMFQTDKTGKFGAVIECVRATRIAGGCTFSNVNAGQTADIPTYQKLAKQIGYDCAISKYQSYGAEAGGQREIVELACGDHPDGAYAFVPTGAGQTGAYYNCARAVSFGLACHLTPMPATYAKIASQIAARGRTTCAVDNARAIGKDDKGQDYLEVTCGAQPSLVLTYSRLPQETLISAVPCAQAPIADACKLKK